MSDKTANLRRLPNTHLRRVGNDNAKFNKANAIAEALSAKWNDEDRVLLEQAVVEAYAYGVREGRRMREGGAVTDAVKSINVYVARQDSNLDLTREQMFYILHFAHLGAGLERQARIAKAIYEDPVFVDMPSRGSLVDRQA
jgi:hypothetical protein